MRAMYKPNISATGRLVSTVAGAALTTVGYRRSNRVLGLLGLGLLGRGASGWCPVTAAIDRDAPQGDSTKRHLSGARGVIVEDAITIYRPIDEVYTYWRHLENLPQFMDHLEEVHVIDGYHSLWVARGPLGVRVEWEAEIINDIPPTLLSWKSVGDSDVITAGSVRFKSVGDHATEVRVKMQYDPPAGKLGATVAWLVGEDPQNQIAEDLRNFKQILETGEVSTNDRYRATPSSQRMRRGLDSSDLSGEFGSMR
ncbi:MAG TPA: SRPBCC family protein [Vicinamibacterales bacterium]|nr:SRPBCC family protein [Vicinamibacterales bacterium]